MNPRTLTPVPVAKDAILVPRELAAALGRGMSYVSAMRAAGYAFKYRRTTTLEHAQAWLKSNPSFCTTGYYKQGAKAFRELAMSGAAA